MANGLARKGTAKYDEQVWAGLIDDARRYAELAQARVPARLGPMGHAAGAGPSAAPSGSESTATTASEVQGA